MNIYDIKVKDTDLNEIDLSIYKGKVMLIVNTATGCGFTPQYKGLQALYDKYQAQGLEILDFPCNQFLGQAPGTNQEVANFCQLRFGTTFQTFGKIEVNGKNTEPLYKYLKEESVEKNLAGKKGFLAGILLDHGDIKWNFTKFLVDRSGEVVGRFESAVTPEEMEETVKTLVEQV